MFWDGGRGSAARGVEWGLWGSVKPSITPVPTDTHSAPPPVISKSVANLVDCELHVKHKIIKELCMERREGTSTSLASLSSSDLSISSEVFNVFTISSDDALHEKRKFFF